MNPVKSLKVYQKSFELCLCVYKTTKQFPKEELFGLTSQIRRCAVSIPSNIAEGKGRFSTNDYCRFLGIAKGSLFELQTQLEIALELEYLSRNDFVFMDNLADEIGRMLTAMITKLNPKA